MALLTQSESSAFNGFLSSVDFSDVLEWSAVADTINIPPAPEKGKEAILAKAAKDLMSLESNLREADSDSAAALARHSETSTAINPSWPSIPGDQSDQQQRRTHSYTYGFGAPSRTSHRLRLPSHNPPGGSTQPVPESLYGFSRSESPTNTSSSSSPFGVSTPTGAESSASHNGRPAPFGVASAPSVLGNQHHPPSSKRSLPPDADSWLDKTSPSAEQASSKRRRPSAASQHTVDTAPKVSTRGTRATRTSSTSSSTVAGSSNAKERDADIAVDTGASKPALLTPSQKRANHIQSEQKRRANIRRGYEALCEAVPALKEAIRLEEEATRVADEEATGKGKRKRKGKAAAEDGGMDKGADGRAGPKSENVVLQKTIDHLNALLVEQATLKSRLAFARNSLPQGHPASVLSSEHCDDNGVPLWEREWNGGSGWKDNDDDDGDE